MDSKLQAQHLAITESLNRARKNFRDFSYKQAVEQDGKESADLQLNRLAEEVDEWVDEREYFYKRTGSKPADFK